MGMGLVGRRPRTDQLRRLRPNLSLIGCPFPRDMREARVIFISILDGDEVARWEGGSRVTGPLAIGVMQNMCPPAWAVTVNICCGAELGKYGNCYLPKVTPAPLHTPSPRRLHSDL